MQSTAPHVHVPGSDDNVRIVYVTAPAAPARPTAGCCGRRNNHLNSSAIFRISVLQIVFGMICCSANALDMVIGCEIKYIYWSSGISSGVLFILAGLFGLAAGQSKYTGWIVTLLIFSILSCLNAWYTLAMAILELHDASDNDFLECDIDSERKASLVLASFQVIACISEIIAALSAVVMGSLGINSCCKTANVEPEDQISAGNHMTYSQGGQLTTIQQEGIPIQPTAPLPVSRQAVYSGQSNPGYARQNNSNSLEASSAQGLHVAT